MTIMSAFVEAGRAAYHERCGMRLWDCPSCGALICGCEAGHQMRRHYDRWGVPYRGQEREPVQMVLGRFACDVCGEAVQSRVHRAHTRGGGG